MLKTFVMMIGEFEYENIFSQDPGDSPFQYYSIVIFIVFVLVMGIVIMNLLVGLAVDDIKEIQENAELLQLSMNVSRSGLVALAAPRWSWCWTWRDSSQTSSAALEAASWSATRLRSSTSHWARSALGLWRTYSAKPASSTGDPNIGNICSSWLTYYNNKKSFSYSSSSYYYSYYSIKMFPATSQSSSTQTAEPIVKYHTIF